MSMTITVSAGNPGAVLIVIPGADLTDTEAWTLTGSAGYDSWNVRGGSGTGDGTTAVTLVDPACPVNVTVTYTLTVGDTTVTATTTRTYTGEDLIMSLDGGTVAHVLRTSAGSDTRQSARRFNVSAVPGATFPPLRLGVVAGAGGGSMQVETDSSNTETLRALLATNAPVVSLHNPSGCYDGCTIPLTEMIYITADRNDVFGQIVTNRRIWDLSYILVADPEPDYRVPVSTWGDMDAAGLTFGDVDALSLTWGDLDTLDWSTV